jgi:hypothetical protein
VLLPDLQIKHGGRDGVVTEQCLDRAQIDARFQQVCCKAMPQGVHADAFANTGLPLGAVIHLLRHALMDGMLPIDSLKQVFLGPVLFPILPQVFQQAWRQNRVAVLAPFPCTTRMLMRALSISPTRNETASPTRSPAA